MKNVILSIAAVGLGLAALAGAYKLGQLSHGRFQAIAVGTTIQKVDTHTGRIWFVNGDNELEPYGESESIPEAVHDKPKAAWQSLPMEDVKSLVVLDIEGGGQRQVQRQLYNPTRWNIQTFRVKVTATGPAPEQNWERIYAVEKEIMAETQDSFVVAYFDQVQEGLKLEIVSASGIKADLK